MLKQTECISLLSRIKESLREKENYFIILLIILKQLKDKLLSGRAICIRKFTTLNDKKETESL